MIPWLENKPGRANRNEPEKINHKISVLNIPPRRRWV